MKSRVTAAELDLLARKIQRENMVARYKAVWEEREVTRRLKAAEKFNNLQREHGALLEAHRRLPLGLQRDAFRRLHALSQQMGTLRGGGGGLVIAPLGPFTPQAP